MNETQAESVHVILAEDDGDDSMFFLTATELLSFPIMLSLAEDGEMLMALLKNKVPPNVIFLDLRMPRLNGQQCLKEIRSRSEFDHIPIIIFTELNDQPHIDECYNSGANYYVIKPDSFEGLLKVLEKAFKADWKKIPEKETFVIEEGA
jgi:CheY-like chemotaxis protein